MKGKFTGVTLQRNQTNPTRCAMDKRWCPTCKSPLCEDEKEEIWATWIKEHPEKMPPDPRQLAFELPPLKPPEWEMQLDD
jgi:hypothetical protein